MQNPGVPMPPLKIRFPCFFAGVVRVAATLDAQSPAGQGKTAQDSAKQNAPAILPDASLGQATLLMQQGKNEEALKFLESIAAAEPARRGVVRQIGIAYYRKSDFLK